MHNKPDPAEQIVRFDVLLLTKGNTGRRTLQAARDFNSVRFLHRN